MLKTMAEFLEVPQLEEVSLPLPPNIVTCGLSPSETIYLENGKIEVTQFLINTHTDPDIALINAYVSTPPQLNLSKSTIFEVITGSLINKKSGIILVSPENQVQSFVYDPNLHGGNVGLKVPQNWAIQIILSPDSHIQFYELWTPRGFSSPEENSMESYGSKNFMTLSDCALTSEFIDTRNRLQEYLNQINKLNL